jgi:Type III restriction enzyme, res subunit
MTTTELPYLQTLRTLYDEAIAELNTTRNNSLTNDFSAKIADAVFEATSLALNDAATDTHRMLTVSAPCGSGKTSFSYAIAAAVTRLAERDLSAPYGVVFLVERREQVEKTYQDLNALLPGKVIAWTQDHDVTCDKPEKVKNPTARSSKSDLPNAPVIVVTHAFYLSSKNGHLARQVVRNGVPGQRARALTIVDERPDEAPTQSITLGDAEKVREAMVERNPETKPHMDALFLIMEQCNYGPKNQLLRPGKELPWSDVQRELWWFQSKEAERLALANASLPGVSAFFHFAKAFVLGRGFAATDGLQATFYAYANQTVVDKTAGVILLDATADIDGRSKIVPWIVEIPTPQANFSNLEMVVMPPHSRYLKTRMFLGGTKTILASTIPAAIPQGSNGTLRDASSAQHTMVQVLAPTIGRMLMWWCSLMTSFCPKPQQFAQPKACGRTM